MHKFICLAREDWKRLISCMEEANTLAAHHVPVLLHSQVDSWQVRQVKAVLRAKDAVDAIHQLYVVRLHLQQTKALTGEQFYRAEVRRVHTATRLPAFEPGHGHACRQLLVPIFSLRALQDAAISD